MFKVLFPGVSVPTGKIFVGSFMDVLCWNALIETLTTKVKKPLMRDAGITRTPVLSLRKIPRKNQEEY